MKIIFSIILFTLSLKVLSCDSVSERLLLTDGETLSLDVHGYETIKLVAKNVGPVIHFNVEKPQNYAGFECTIENVVKLAEGCWEVSVNWSPGADFSGCDIRMSTNTGKVYKAFLYMDYHAH